MGQISFLLLIYEFRLLKYFFQLDLAFDQQNTAYAFEFVEKMFHSGKDLVNCVEELVEHYRNLLLAKMPVSQQHLIHLAEGLKEQYLQTAGYYEELQCLYILDYLMQIMQHLHKSPFKKITLEMILLKIIRSKNRISPQALIQRLAALENKTTPNLAPTVKAELQKTTPAKAPLAPEKKEPPVKKEPLKLQPTPLALASPKTAETPPKAESHYDTLMRFTAVELEGIVKKQTDIS